MGGCAILELITGGTPSAMPVVQVYRAEPADGHRIRRVGMLPFVDLSGHAQDAEDIESILLSAMRQRRAFDVVTLPPTALTDREEKDFYRDATVHQETLVRLHRDYNVDAVIFGTITHYKPYSPIVLGIKLDMFSAGAGDVIWEVNAHYDSRNQDVVQDVHNYHDTVLAPSGSLEDYRIILMSPRQFAAYACARIAATW
jgi:hypothetical protein